MASTPRGGSATPEDKDLSPSRPTPPRSRHDRWKGAAKKARSTAAAQPLGAFNARHRNDAHVATVAAQITRRTSAPPRRVTPTAAYSKRQPRPEQYSEGRRYSAPDTVRHDQHRHNVIEGRRAARKDGQPYRFKSGKAGTPHNPTATLIHCNPCPLHSPYKRGRAGTPKT